MKIRLLSFAVALGMFALAQPAAAQGEKGDVSFGYQFVNLSGDSDSQSLPTGWFVDLAGNLSQSLAVVAQIGGNYKSFEQSASFGGASASANASFAGQTFAASGADSRTNVALQAGAGINLKFCLVR